MDVHKAIRRMAPAPRNRVPKGKLVPDSGHSNDTYLKGVNGSVEEPTNTRQSVGRSISATNANRTNKVLTFEKICLSIANWNCRIMLRR